MYKMKTSPEYNMVYNVFQKVTAESIEDTSMHAGRYKAYSERLISRVKNIWFPQTPSARKMVISTSVPTWATVVPNRRNLVPYSMDEKLVKKVNEVKKVIKKDGRTKWSTTSSTKTKTVQQ